MTPKVLLQCFYKRGKYIAVPCPADPADGPHVDWWWDHLAKNAHAIAATGFTAVWLPPVSKAMQGMSAAALGYSVFDDYDIGSKDQKATVHTRYGNREQLARCAAVLRANGLEIYLDLQLNHRRGGAGSDEMTFEYADAFGKTPGGRFPKNRSCFHSRYPSSPVPPDFTPEIAQDPHVPDGIWELQENSNVYFGPDLAHINAEPPRYVADHVNANVEWLTRALDVQGYRIDHVQGISTDFLRELLSRDLLRDSFAVGEFWDGDAGHVDDWVHAPHWMNGRCSAFDFPLYFKLLAMSNDPAFDMGTLEGAGLAARDPFHAVTFVENHDTESRRDLVARNIQPDDKPLAYAYILTSEGYPCVFYKDWSTDAGCLGGVLQPLIVNLVWIHQHLAAGPTQQRWKDPGVYVFERLGGPGLLVAMNKDKTAARSLQGVETAFGGNVRLHDYTGHADDITTDAESRVSLTIPRNHGGLGYVCYSVSGIDGAGAIGASTTTQVYEGAADLDIPPATTQGPTRACRVHASAGSEISATLAVDAVPGLQGGTVMLALVGPDGRQIAQQSHVLGASGPALSTAAATTGWHVCTVLAQDVTADAQIPFSLAVTYLAPQVMTAPG